MELSQISHLLYIITRLRFQFRGPRSKENIKIKIKLKILIDSNKIDNVGINAQNHILGLGFCPKTFQGGMNSHEGFQFRIS